MIDARFSHLYFYYSVYTLQRGLPAIAGLLVKAAMTEGNFEKLTTLPL